MKYPNRALFWRAVFCIVLLVLSILTFLKTSSLLGKVVPYYRGGDEIYASDSTNSTAARKSALTIQGRKHTDFNLTSLKNDRRTNLITCGARHSFFIQSLIQQKFHLTEVSRNSEDWDLIYGGYPHCGQTDGLAPLDWEMKTGLNQRINEKGWENLKPHQIWFPCMGCKDSYCEKNQLCYLLREVDPSACYVLPEDKDRLTKQMDGQKLWVLKRDGKYLQLHAGQGVSYIKNVAEIPEQASDGTYLVMPYLEPFLGQGQYRRKAELRVYIAITSLFPLRLYLYKRMWVVLAGSIYTSSADVDNKCIHDTHAHAKGICDGGLTVMQRQMTFEDYASKTNMTPTMQEDVQRQTRKLLSGIIHGANPSIQKHYVNEGIHRSGAACFSYMRADLGITDEGKVVVFEINQFPYTNEEAPSARSIQVDGHIELFRMIGLDVPPIYGEDKRGEYERQHLGEWEPLSP
eukprot:scaffold37433_cov199-Amphora_coffeaeformis.AAC.1